MKKLFQVVVAGILAVTFSTNVSVAGRFGGGFGGGGFGGGGMHVGGGMGGMGGAHFGGGNLGGGMHFGGGGLGGGVGHFGGDMGHFGGGMGHIGGGGLGGGVGRPGGFGDFHPSTVGFHPTSAFGGAGGIRPGGINSGGIGHPYGGYGAATRPFGGNRTDINVNRTINNTSINRVGVGARPGLGYGGAGIYRGGVGYDRFGVGGREALGHAYYRPNYYGNWYHGNWHNNWDRPWYGRPIGWGYGWGGYGGAFVAGAMLSPWNWGYWGYSNPYYSYSSGPAYLDYSQPIVSADTTNADPNATDNAAAQTVVAGQTDIPGVAVDQPSPKDAAMQLFDTARVAFRSGDYEGALKQVEQALEKLPKDSVLQEFRALVLFAQQDYKGAAAPLYAVLSAGPGWDWTTLIHLYANIDVYTDQVRTLEEYRKVHPDSAEARFVLAYHYLTQGHGEAAAKELAKVVELNPRDALSAQILKSLTPPAAGDETPPTPDSELKPADSDVKPGDTKPAQPIDQSKLIGNWTASRDDGSTFALTLTKDRKFTWKFTLNKKTQEYKGPYELADNVLILKQNDSPAMVFDLKPVGTDSFNFKLAGGDPADPGLVFSK